MSHWRLDPEGIQAVLTTTSNEQQELSAALEQQDFEAIFAGLNWAPSITGHVAQAVSNLVTDQQNNLSGVCNRIAAGVLGVMNATRSYNQGQQEMAEKFDSEMLRAASTGDFSYFDEHGYKGE